MSSSKKRKTEDSPVEKKKKKKTSISEETNNDDDDSPLHPGAKSYEERLLALSPIASPLADDKLTKKLYKLVKKASSAKGLRRGVKEVVKAIRKGATGLCIIAGDVSPVDVICHIPIFCEEKTIAYIYVPSKQDLGYAALTKRPTSCVLISPKDGFEHADLLEKTIAKVQKATTSSATT